MFLKKVIQILFLLLIGLSNSFASVNKIDYKKSQVIINYLKSLALEELTNIIVASINNSVISQSTQQQYSTVKQLKLLSLEELMTVEVFNPKAGIAARKQQGLMETAGALFVLTQEDIRRSGMTKVPELLRMIPGVQVAHIDANKWAISARGFNNQYSSKLLVMIDGRSVYTHLRSAVYWDVQDLLIENIDRIEVIRGPGATLWGANAVNGVINIVTKSAKDTQGNLITTHVGVGEERAIVGFQHGGKLKNGLAYRVYGKFQEHEDFVTLQGEINSDRWQSKMSGFRVDWDIKHNDSITIQGDAYEGFAKQNLFMLGEDQVNVDGLNLLGRWQHNLDAGEIILQTYYDHIHRKDASLKEERTIYDIDFQHRWERSETEEYLWGIGFHNTQDDIDSLSLLTYSPPEQTYKKWSAFLQGDFSLNPNVQLTLGSKFEYNDYTEFEYQPTIRTLWNINQQHQVWAAISRAVHTPSRSERYSNYNTFNPLSDIFLSIIANPNLKSEELLAYELGYRFNPTEKFLLDIAIFSHEYNQLRSMGMPSFDMTTTPLTILYQSTNGMWGEIYGLELATHWQILKNWKLISTYSYLDVQLHINGEDEIMGESDEKNDPHHQATLRSLLSLPNHLELDTSLYYVSRLDAPGSGEESPPIHSYLRTDIRFGWRPNKTLDLSIGVRNLFDNQHSEFGNSFNGNRIIASEVERAAYVQFKYKF
ncbi:MAG: TonB-dependent receptor [Thiomargarita sp.]|nr:TonB-dependent receptor [Thiomargarita sp.]